MPPWNWSSYQPLRYQTQGSVERLLNQGVEEIYVVDYTVGGARFSKHMILYTRVSKR